jgi:hypothetical protein
MLRQSLGSAALIAASSLLPQAAEAASTQYTISMAGLPIGSVQFEVSPNGSSAGFKASGRIGGALDLGRFDAQGTIGTSQATAETRSGSGKDIATAKLASNGAAANRTFSYEGVNSRGPGRIAMSIANGDVAWLAAELPDNPRAVRVPVTDDHKRGVVDPLMLASAVIRPSGSLLHEGLCGRRHQVFTGQVRFDLAGSAARPTDLPRGAPAGWTAMTCKVAYTPVSGHRIDKGARAQPRTATLVFVESPDRKGGALWSLSVPTGFGSFALTATQMQ